MFVITDFRDRATEDVFNGVNSKQARKFSQDLWKAIRRRLDALNAATSLQDVKANPGNRLEPLKGALSGFYSVRVNNQYRVTFKFENGNASDVTCEDYH